ncbi:MAG: hypothetical protein V1698_00710 [bacterium]
MKLKIFLCAIFFIAGLFLGAVIKKTANPLASVGNEELTVKK